MTDEPFLSRWSRRKNQSRGEAVEGKAPPPAEPVSEALARGSPAPPPPVAEARPLPPIESLTPESDFTGFMKPEVEEGLKRRALKTLFQDPHFNVMDGLDVYIDDYSKPDPLPEGWLAQMNQVARLGDYQEPKPESAKEGAGEAPESASAQPAGLEKPSTEQGLAVNSPSPASDTPDSVIKPSPVRE